MLWFGMEQNRNMADSSHSILSIPVAHSERALLEAAAEHAGVNLSDFMRCKTVEAAETELLERRLVTIPAANWGKIEAWVDTPPREIPALLQSPVIRSADLARPLTANDDRYTFDCGRMSLNRWFWHHAWQDQEADMARTHVAVDPTAGDVMGYVSLSLAEIKCTPHPSEPMLPDDRPATLPAALLGRLAIDRGYQHIGHAQSLIRFALGSAVRVSRDIGCFCMVTHPLDDGVRTFFRTFGFEDIPGDPTGGMAISIADLEHNLVNHLDGLG